MRALRDQLPGRHFVIGVVALSLLAFVLVFNYYGGLRGAFTVDGAEIQADFPSTATLAVGDPVRVRGVQVGKVREVEPLADAEGSRVTMTLADAAQPLYRDASAEVSWRSLLGGAFVVEVDPGTSSAGRLGSQPIPLSQTTAQVELDDVTSVARGDARSGLKQIPTELSAALAEPDAVRGVAGTLADVAPDVDRGLGGLRGQLPDKDLRDLVSATAATMDALDDPAPLSTVVAGGAVTFETTAARAADIRTTLAQAPAAMDNTNATLADLDGTLDVLDPLVSRLQAPAGDLAPALRALNPLLTDADRLLDDARPLLEELPGTVRAVGRVGRHGVPLLNEFEPSLVRFDDRILPYVDERDEETQHTMAEMFGPGAGGLALVAAQLDPNGHYLRFPASAGSGSFYLPCQTFAGNPDSDKFVECKNINELVDTYLNYDPAAGAPGSSGGPAQGEGER